MAGFNLQPGDVQVVMPKAREGTPGKVSVAVDKQARRVVVDSTADIRQIVLTPNGARWMASLLVAGVSALEGRNA